MSSTSAHGLDEPQRMNAMQRAELLRVIEQNLGLPRSDPQKPEFQNADSRRLFATLRIRNEELRQAAKMVGIPPEGYPLHARIVIRIVSALLSWYTRPLRRWAELAAETSALTS